MKGELLKGLFIYLQDTGIGDGMVAGLSFRAIVELITSSNDSGLRSFLATQHANVDDKNEVNHFLPPIKIQRNV